MPMEGWTAASSCGFGPGLAPSDDDPAHDRRHSSTPFDELRRPAPTSCDFGKRRPHAAACAPCACPPSSCTARRLAPALPAGEEIAGLIPGRSWWATTASGIAPEGLTGEMVRGARAPRARASGLKRLIPKRHPKWRRAPVYPGLFR